MKTRTKNALGTAILLCFFGLIGQVEAATTVGLGTADGFTVLAGSTITNTGPSTIDGDIGVSPGSAVTGFPPGTITGTQQVTNAVAVQAQVDLATAYANAAGQPPVSTVPTELGGTTKTAGVYDSAAGTFGVSGTLTLDAQGDPDAVFIFKASSTLITAAASSVVLANGAQACNIFWQVGSSATLGTNSALKGSVLAFTSITLNADAAVEGRLLARNGAVTLDTNIITKATCAVVPPPAIVPFASLGGGSFAPLPLIQVVKAASPAALPLGPGLVRYTYAVTNTAVVSMIGVWVKDNRCEPVTYVSGDADADDLLDLGEEWLFQCSKMLGQTEMNVVTVHGQANGWDTYDTDELTVVVLPAVVATVPDAFVADPPFLAPLPSPGFPHAGIGPGVLWADNLTLIFLVLAVVGGLRWGVGRRHQIS